MRRPAARPLVRLLLLCLAVLLTQLAPAPGSVAAEAPAPTRDGAWPLDPRPAVVAGFDPPEVRWGSGHRGVDLAGWPGAPVRSSLAGTVAFVGVVAGRGVVIVQHGGLRTTYQPVAASVSVGDRVARGAVIGTLLHAGSHCFPGSCLHWGLKRGDVYLDPLLLVGGGPVRLLPLAPAAPAPAGRARGWPPRAV